MVKTETGSYIFRWLRCTRYTAVTNEYERWMRVLRGFRGSSAKVIVSLKVNYSGATF